VCPERWEVPYGAAYLNSGRAARLREILASAFSDLRMEIAHTDAMDFHGLLKQRKAFLMKLLQDLPPELA
jgi:hypothetical protein